MSATVHILPLRAAIPCRRCGGLRRITYDQMTEAQKQWAPAGSIFPCPDCGDDAEVIPFEPAARARASLERFEAAMVALCDCLAEPLFDGHRPEGTK